MILKIPKFAQMAIEDFRVPLSEATPELRARAIDNFETVLNAQRQEAFTDFDPVWHFNPENRDGVIETARSLPATALAAAEYAETVRRFEKENGRRLELAETIGCFVVEAINEKKFTGIHTTGGILEQMRDYAKENEIFGGKDKDTLFEIWKTYKPVVHLGMALAQFPGEEYRPRKSVFGYAKHFQSVLSENAPSGRKEPYVDPNDQITFVAIS